MREILFRGKRADNGVWIVGDLRHWRSGKVGIHCDATGRTLPVRPETVGQYTGLEDKNGRMIFEGDVVTGLFVFGMEVRAVVGFGNGSFGLEWWRGNVPEFTAFTSTCNMVWGIVGNIHDEITEEMQK